jgi:hypothetical protein
MEPAGRLDVEEYADRSARAAEATVASEIEELFTDLPAPHPDLPTASGATRAPLAPAAASSAAEPGPFSGWLPRIAAATPIVATILFFVFIGVFPQARMFFLLIPLMGALGFSKGHRDREIRKDD